MDYRWAKDLQDYMEKNVDEKSEAQNLMNEVNKLNNESKDFDQMLADILKDLEFAEVSLESTSHLLDSGPTGNDPELDGNAREEMELIDNLISDLNSKPRNNVIEESTLSIIIEEPTESFVVEEPTLVKENNEDVTTHDEQESNSPSLEFPANTTEPPIPLEDTKPSIDTGTGETAAEVENSTECLKRENNHSSSRTENKTDLKIAFPSNNPYVNFVQDFRAKYRGHEVTSTTIIAMAAAKWRKMARDEKILYKNLSKSHREKNKQVEKLKNYIKSLRTPEDVLFRPSEF